MLHIANRLTILLIALFCTGAEQPTETLIEVAEGVCRAEERPQWSDLGMNDLLAAGYGGSVASQNHSRPTHSTATATTAGTTARCCSNGRATAIVLPRHDFCRRGYIYMIRCLRL